MRSARTRRFDLAWQAGHFLGTESARGRREQPESPTLSRTRNRGAFREEEEFWEARKSEENGAVR